MSINSKSESVEIRMTLADNIDLFLGGKIKIDVELSNKSNNELELIDVIIHYQCLCSINLFHLKRFNKKNDVDKVLSDFNQRFTVTNNRLNANFPESCDLVLTSTEFVLLEHRLLKEKETYRIPIRIRIPEESIFTYKSKYIHFSNEIRAQVRQSGGRETLEAVVPVSVNRYAFRDASQCSESDSDDFCTLNTAGSPFDLLREHNSDDSLDTDFSRLQLDNIANQSPPTRYKITYRDNELCYLTSVKPYLSIADDIKLVLNFVPDSLIRCIRFSVTLKAKEILLIPSDPNSNQDSFELCLSTKEFGPFFHESWCIDVYPLVIRIPDDQQPSLNFEIFKFEWILDFKFIIANSSDVTIDIDAPPQKEPVSWSFRNDINTELLKWELPITVHNQKILEY